MATSPAPTSCTCTPRPWSCACRPPARRSTDSPLLMTFFTKSLVRISAATRTFLPKLCAAGDHRALADHRDPGVQAPGLLPVWACLVGPLADDAPWPITTSLSRIARSTTAPDRSPSRTSRSSRGRPPRPRRGRPATAPVHDRAVDHAAVADEATVDLGGRADLGRRALLGTGMDDPVGVVQVELRVVLEEASCWPPRTTGSCRRPASSRCSGSRRHGRPPRHVRDDAAPPDARTSSSPPAAARSPIPTTARRSTWMASRSGSTCRWPI